MASPAPTASNAAAALRDVARFYDLQERQLAASRPAHGATPSLAQTISAARLTLAQQGAKSEALAARLEEELATTRALAFEPLRVLYLIWKKPWMTVSSGTYVSAALREIGLVTVAPASPLRYPALEFGSFGPEHWDAVLLASEPYRFTEAHARALRADPALRGRPVALIDGEMTSWYGSRAVAALGDLREYRRRFEHTAGLSPRPGTPLASCAGAAS